MENYIPKYIKQHIDYLRGEYVEADDYNDLHNLLITATDYNTETINAIINDAEVRLVINAEHALKADVATLAEDSAKLSGATLSRFAVTSLLDNDNTIPSSKQVKEYVDTNVDTIMKAIDVANKDLDAVIIKNTEQDNRLNTIDVNINKLNSNYTILENYISINRQAINEIQVVDNTQNVQLSGHEERIKNLELENVPDDVVKTLMTKGGYAVATGEVDEQGQPIYSADTVKKSLTSQYLTLNGVNYDAATFATDSDLAELADDSFIRRGELPVVSDYNVGFVRSLKHGAYETLWTQSELLNVGNNSGTLRVYPSNQGTSLEFEVQAGNELGYIKTIFIPLSVPETVAMNTLVWNDLSANIQENINSIDALEQNKLNITGLMAGIDTSVNASGNTVVINYTGPKIVLGGTQPAPDPNRDTLWINL